MFEEMMLRKIVPVFGFEGFYMISNIGEVFRVKGKCLKELALYKTVLGYQKVMLSVLNKKYVKSVHTLVLESFKGPSPLGMECCHYDGDRSNNKIENLRWDTRKGNQGDRKRHGTLSVNRGDKNPRSKLNMDKAREIRRLADLGFSQKDIGNRFSVSQQTVKRITQNKGWKEL